MVYGAQCIKHTVILFSSFTKNNFAKSRFKAWTVEMTFQGGKNSHFTLHQKN